MEKTIVNDLQEITQSKVMRNPKNCKEKWNGINGDYIEFFITIRTQGTIPCSNNLVLKTKTSLCYLRFFIWIFLIQYKLFMGRGLSTPLSTSKIVKEVSLIHSLPQSLPQAVLQLWPESSILSVHQYLQAFKAMEKVPLIFPSRKNLGVIWSIQWWT